MSEVKKLQIFKSHNPHIQFIFAGRNAEGKENGIAGKAAVFFNGEYRTDIQAEIDELNREIDHKHPLIHRDVNRMEMDAEDVDPMVALKKKHFQEFQDEQVRAMNASGNTSNSNPAASGAGTGVATTASAGGNAAASNSGEAPAAGPTGVKVILPAGFKSVPKQ